MAPNTWKIIVSSSIGIEVSQDEVNTVDEALEIVEAAMREMANDPGSDISIEFNDQPLDGAGA